MSFFKMADCRVFHVCILHRHRLHASSLHREVIYPVFVPTPMQHPILIENAQLKSFSDEYIHKAGIVNPNLRPKMKQQQRRSPPKNVPNADNDDDDVAMPMHGGKLNNIFRAK